MENRVLECLVGPELNEADLDDLLKSYYFARKKQEKKY